MRDKYITRTNNGVIYLNENAFKRGFGTCYISEFELGEKKPNKYTRHKLVKLLKNWIFSCEDIGEVRIKRNKINKYLDWLWCDLCELGWCDPSCFIDEWEELDDDDFEKIRRAI